MCKNLLFPNLDTKQHLKAELAPMARQGPTPSQRPGDWVGDRSVPLTQPRGQSCPSAALRSTPGRLQADTPPYTVSLGKRLNPKAAESGHQLMVTGIAATETGRSCPQRQQGTGVEWTAQPLTEASRIAAGETTTWPHCSSLDPNPAPQCPRCVPRVCNL